MVTAAVVWVTKTWHIPSLTFHEAGDAAHAHPVAFTLGLDRQQRAVVLGGAAHEALHRYVVFRLVGEAALVLVDGVLVEGHRLALFDGQRPGRADGQAEAGPVAQLFAADPRFAVYQLDSAFGAGGHAFSAACTQIVIYSDYFPLYSSHFLAPLLCCCL
jgi:hypothetical protein